MDRETEQILVERGVGPVTPEWRTDIENAPKDGSDVLFPIEFVGRAYWCDDLKRWVLAYPLRMEYVSHPTRFRLPMPKGRL